MAKFFKVVKGEVGGYGNKVHKKGAEVTDEMFPPGNAEDLEKMGILESIKAPKKKATEPKTEKVEETELENDESDNDEIKPIGDYNKDQIMDLLTDRKIEFNPLDKKAELYDLLK